LTVKGRKEKTGPAPSGEKSVGLLCVTGRSLEKDTYGAYGAGTKKEIVWELIEGDLSGCRKSTLSGKILKRNLWGRVRGRGRIRSTPQTKKAFSKLSGGGRQNMRMKISKLTHGRSRPGIGKYG